MQPGSLHTSACPLDCPDACGVLVETDSEGRFVRIRGNPAHSYSRGALCGKTAMYGEIVQSPDRLRTPLLRAADGSFEPLSWELALDRVASRLSRLEIGRTLALSYAGSMGLAARQYPMRVMNAIGAIATDGGICDNTGTAGYQSVMGHVVGPDIETLGDADCVLLWGTDVKRTAQHLQPYIQSLCRRGVAVFAIDIYRTETIEALERWGGQGLILKPGTDAALALGLARLALDRGAADEAFLGRECHGWPALKRELESGYELAGTGEITGLSRELLLLLAERLFAARRPFIKTGVGWTRRRNGAMSMRAVCSLAAVLGHADRLHFESGDHFGLDADVIARSDLRPAAADSKPIRHVELGSELASGRFGAVVVWGHNPAETVPDSRAVRTGLQRDDLFVVVHEQFMTETARLADVVLPATTFVEQTDLYRSYGHRVLQLGRKVVDPPDEQRSNVSTFSALGRALGLAPEIWDVSEEGLCLEILESARRRIGDDDLERVLAGEPVKLEERSFADRGTPSGKIELRSEAAVALGQPAVARYVPDDSCGGRGAFGLVLAPSRATHNTTFSHSKRHQQRAGAARCFLNPADAAARGLSSGDPVRLRNEHGQLTLQAEVTSDMPAGVVRIDGFPAAWELPERVGVNVLTGSAVSDLGDGSVLFSHRVDLEPI